MGSAVDTTEPRERRGLSRRDMIKGAAVAGAAAWTAPVIIDSLTSPAAAASVCNIYWEKLTNHTGSPVCFSACPGSSSLFPVSDAKWAGSCGDPGCGVSGGLQHMPTAVGTSGSNYTVTLAANCVFDSSKTSWAIGGRYNNSYQYGSATNNTNSGSVPKQLTVSGNNIDLDYIYLKFCCSTA